MTSASLHTALLRPAVIQILRAAGFSYTKPAVLEALTDMAARYLLLLTESTIHSSLTLHDSVVPTVQDVRLALLQAGALWPQMGPMEEQKKGIEMVDGLEVPFEDMRGVQGFVDWAQGDVNKEIRRIAGFGGDESVGELAAELGEEAEDYVTALKKKHSKTDTESRYAGTALGRDADEVAPVTIVGGSVASISEWSHQVNSQHVSAGNGLNSSGQELESATPGTMTSGISSAPQTPPETRP